MKYRLVMGIFSLGIFMATLSAAAEEVKAPLTNPSVRTYQVVFQISESNTKNWNLLLNNVRNTQTGLSGYPLALEIVAYGPGIDMIRLDSKVAARVQEAIKSGVRVKVCETTMKLKHLTREHMIPNMEYVPSGIVEIIVRQREGYSYIRP
jgi:intracellular sulfur oxidation DsrE/DsrF family protein